MYNFTTQLPTLLAFVNALRQRGSQFGGLGAANLGGPTGVCISSPIICCVCLISCNSICQPSAVWSMPGGFTSGGREGYQTVDDDAFVRNVRPGPAVPQKSAPPADLPSAPGAYQSV